MGEKEPFQEIVFSLLVGAFVLDFIMIGFIRELKEKILSIKEKKDNDKRDRQDK